MCICWSLCLSVCWSLYKCHSQAHVGIPLSCHSFILSFLFFFLYIPHDIHLQLLSVCLCVCVYIPKTTQQGHSISCNEENSWCLCSSWVLVSNDDCKEILFFFFVLFSFWWTTRKHDFTFCVCLPQTSPMFFSTQTQTHKYTSTQLFPLVLFCCLHSPTFVFHIVELNIENKTKQNRKQKKKNKEEEIDSTFDSKFQ